MSAAHADRRPFLRGGLAAVVVVDLASFYFFLRDARADALAGGLALGVPLDLLTRPAIAAAVILVGIVGAVAFALKPGRLGYGAAPLAALILLSTAHAQLYGSPWRHLYYSGLCLAGWLIGLAVSRRRGGAVDESYARMGSIALLGAAYFNAGSSKIAFGGLAWLSGLPIQAAIVAQDGMVADSALSSYRFWVVSTPAVAALFSVLTVAFELAGPLMIDGRRVRLGVVFGLLAMHLNLYVLTPILYWEAMVLLLLFGPSAERPGAEAAAPSSSIVSSTRRFNLVAAVLAVCAVVAIVHQASRFARLRATAAVSVESPMTPGVVGERPADTSGPRPPAGPRQVGPLAVGQALTESWRIDALAVKDQAVIVALVGQPGRVRFEITCDSQHQSPFDLGEAHILFSQHVDFAALEGAGWALRHELEEAAKGRDVCDRLADWRMSAR